MVMQRTYGSAVLGFTVGVQRKVRVISQPVGWDRGCAEGRYYNVSFANLSSYNSEPIRFPLLLLGWKWRILRLLDLVLFLIVDVLLLSAVFTLWPVVTLPCNEQSAGQQNPKDESVGIPLQRVSY